MWKKFIFTFKYRGYFLISWLALVAVSVKLSNCMNTIKTCRVLSKWLKSSAHSYYFEIIHICDELAF